MNSIFGVIKVLIKQVLDSILLVYSLIFFSHDLKALNSEKVLQQLTEAHGASGFEEPVRVHLKQYWSNYHINYEIDGMGNLIGRWPTNKGNRPKILIMAHMDEVGFLINKIDEKGYISVIPLGGWMDHVLWSQNWIIKKGEHEISAISGMDPPHVLTDFTKSPVADKKMLFLDTGLSKKNLVELGIRPGLPVTPDQKFKKLSGKRFIGKAFDDRVGLAIMIELMESFSHNPDLIQDVDIVFAATVQEELGMRGSKAVYESLKPDLVLNIDAGIAKDYPVQFTKEDEPKLGQGPTLFIYDGSMVPNDRLVSFISNVATKNNIPIQWEAEVSYGEDASCLQTSGQGMPAINIGFPMRYAHAHVGMIDMDDYHNTIKLLLKTIASLNAENVKAIHY